MDYSYVCVLLMVMTSCYLPQARYVYRRHKLDLDLDDNLISFGGQDYPYHLAVKAQDPTMHSDEKLQGLLKKDTTVETCRPEFRAMKGDHTMCLQDSPKVVFTGVTKADRELILREHNRYRSTSAPEAEDMQKMVWDEKLAELAQKWVQQCLVEHDALNARDVPGYGVFTGQCAAGGFKTWTGALRGWWSEVNEYRFGENPDDYVLSRVGVGHYVQMMQNSTVLVGCGYAECVDSLYRRYYMCNYATGNNGRPAFPYTNGTRCRKCPSHCVDGLCDCDGVFCFNGGRIDISTCTCTCREIYSGPNCMQLNCPEIDKWYCGSQYKPGDCQRYRELKYTCPYMCGLCEAVDGKGLRVALQAETTPAPEIFVSAHGCVFEGQRPSSDHCYKLGFRGRDYWDCETEGGFYGCSDCASFAVRVKHCPVMCGACDPPCDGKRCQNGGTLNPDTCQCICFPHYVGEVCQDFSCPENDVAGCASKFTIDKCKKPFAISHCPYYCGVCKVVLPCDGKVCENRGVLNTDTCNCTCKPGYQGDVCQTFVCPESEPRSCRSYKQKHCSTPRVADECPYYCGRCVSELTTPAWEATLPMDQTVKPGVFISHHGCLYSGERPSHETCLTYGDGGLDLPACASVGGTTQCGDCSNSEIRTQCPVMCAVCNPPCHGKRCENGGKLNTLSCDCLCTKRYIGKWCQTVFCPVSDPDLCGDRVKVDCSQDARLKEDCPYLCGLCTEVTILQKIPQVQNKNVPKVFALDQPVVRVAMRKETIPKIDAKLSVFVSDHGCAFFGDRLPKERCRQKGIRGFDEPKCEPEGGSRGCSQCGDKHISNACPVMCGACDPPCGKKKCVNGGKLKLDGSCACKCLMYYEGEICETVVCPSKERKFCQQKTSADCLIDTKLWKSCPYLCGLCVRPPTTPPPVFISAHGCEYVGKRPGEKKCKYRGWNGFDKKTCASLGGEMGCEVCSQSNKDCPVMCGECDPPCGDKVCLNGGTMKVDGSCQCKCIKFYSGEICQTLECPPKDPKTCQSYTEADCANNGLPKCPYLCGLCVAATVAPTTLPVFVSHHGCRHRGDRLSPDKCVKRGRRGFDSFGCETMGGNKGCDTCSLFSTWSACPVMCGLCDPPCGEKKCLNDGKLLTDGSCKCKCPTIFTGDICETVVCPKADKKMCLTKTPADCPNSKEVRVGCPYLCGTCIPPTTTPSPVFTSEFGCVYVGQQLARGKCLRLGHWGADKKECAADREKMGCDLCATMANDCPVTCGQCPAPCDGMKCLNGGRLNTIKCLCKCAPNFKGDNCEISICGEKTCQNGGTMKTDGSCDCKCPPLHKGDTCETLVCPEKDHKKCGTKTDSDCKAKPKLWASCPILCGVCEKPPPPKFVSSHGCIYIGERSTPYQCKFSGAHGLDKPVCATEGGTFGCEDCETVGKDCPVMCGRCDPPCNGKRCLNGGKLNVPYNCNCKCVANFVGDTCQENRCGDKTCQNGGVLKTDGSCDCKCSKLHVGDTCETLVCPKRDKGKCNTASVADCETNTKLWEDCPILCGICDPPKFTSEFGCTYIGDRSKFKCKKLGASGLDKPQCGTEGGDLGCDKCATAGKHCPVMCGLCDAPCNGKRCLNGGRLNVPYNCNCKCVANFVGDTCQENRCGEKACQNGGVLKTDGSCDCKCSKLHVGDFCETLVCPKKDKGKCKSRTVADCGIITKLWEDCPILCGVCDPPKFTSEFGCSYIGDRSVFNCRKLGASGLDKPQCGSEGGSLGCDDCATAGKHCPVMCGLCDAPCGGKRCVNGGKLNVPYNCNCKCVGNFVGETCERNRCGSKTCENGGFLKTDGSCDCKCSKLHVGDTCETLVCPKKDKGKCKSRTVDDCGTIPKLWEDCPILCGVCQPPPPPTFKSDYGCTYVGDRKQFNCRKLGASGLDKPQCGSEGGHLGCDDCATAGKHCPVMCGLCDAPCDGKRCENRGRLNVPYNCRCKCLQNFQGAACEKLVCPVKDHWKCGKQFSAESCETSDKTWSRCPHMCGLCGGMGR